MVQKDGVSIHPEPVLQKVYLEPVDKVLVEPAYGKVIYEKPVEPAYGKVIYGKPIYEKPYGQGYEDEYLGPKYGLGYY